MFNLFCIQVHFSVVLCLHASWPDNSNPLFLQCGNLFTRLDGQCSLDVDKDNVPDFRVSQWNSVPHCACVL